MKPMQVRASSTWFASLVAGLVVLGTQELLEAIVPTSLAEWQAIFSSGDGSSTIYRAGSASLWGTAATVRFLSFALGGLVGVRLAEAWSWRLIIMLLAVATLATAFQQFPGRPAILPLALWSLAGLVGVVLGAWAAKATHRAA